MKSRLVLVQVVAETAEEAAERAHTLAEQWCDYPNILNAIVVPNERRNAVVMAAASRRGT